MYTTDRPYGYWITKEDIHPVVGSCQHYRVAVEVLTKLFEVDEKRIEDSRFDVYRIMFRLGFVRVVNGDGEHNVEYRHDSKLSKLQKQYVKEASYVDKVNYRRWPIRD